MRDDRARLRVVPAAIGDVGRPPLPLPMHVPIVDRDGRPTPEYHQWLTKVYDWQLKLYTFLGGAI